MFNQNEAFIHVPGSTVQCDASRFALGLEQFCSKADTLKPAQARHYPKVRNYAQIEKELLAFVYALRKFNQYVYSRLVHVDTSRSCRC